MNQSAHGEQTGWIYDYQRYKHRPEFELYDVSKDPLSLRNLANESSAQSVVNELKATLLTWRAETNDPWLPCNTENKEGICSV